MIRIPRSKLRGTDIVFMWINTKEQKQTLAENAIIVEIASNNSLKFSIFSKRKVFRWTGFLLLLHCFCLLAAKC